MPAKAGIHAARQAREGGTGELASRRWKAAFRGFATHMDPRLRGCRKTPFALSLSKGEIGCRPFLPSFDRLRTNGGEARHPFCDSLLRGDDEQGRHGS